MKYFELIDRIAMRTPAILENAEIRGTYTVVRSRPGPYETVQPRRREVIISRRSVVSNASMR